MGGGGGAGKPKEPPLLRVRSVLHADAANVKVKAARLIKEKRRGSTSLHVNVCDSRVPPPPTVRLVHSWIQRTLQTNSGEASLCNKSH